MSRDDDTAESEVWYADAGEPRRFSWDRSGRPSGDVPGAVAATTRRDPEALSPMQHHVDVTALDALLTDGPSTAEGDVRVSFDYDGVAVTVDSDGGIEVGSDETERGRAAAGPRTEAELNAMLRGLFHAAFRNGVAVRGGWTVRNGPDVPDWDVHVTRVEKPKNGDASGPL